MLSFDGWDLTLKSRFFPDLDDVIGCSFKALTVYRGGRVRMWSRTGDSKKASKIEPLKDARLVSKSIRFIVRLVISDSL